MSFCNPGIQTSHVWILQFENIFWMTYLKEAIWHMSLTNFILQMVFRSNPKIKPKDWQYKLSNIKKQIQNWVMKYCLIFYFYLAVATKDYTKHHKVGFSLDVDDDFSKIAVISHTYESKFRRFNLMESVLNFDLVPEMHLI